MAMDWMAIGHWSVIIPCQSCKAWKTLSDIIEESKEGASDGFPVAGCLNELASARASAGDSLFVFCGLDALRRVYI